jgi:hypothetical protein
LPLKEKHPVDKTIVLGIEIGWFLYFGVCGWDEKTKTVPKIDEDNKTYVLTNSKKDSETATKYYYWWEYLPEKLEEGVDYRNTDCEYEALFDKEVFEKYINAVCYKIEMFMDEWNR